MAGSEATYRSDREASDAKRATILLTALFVILSLLALNSRQAGAATPTLILGRAHVGEYQPVQGDGFLAWQQNTQKNPGHYDVYARPLGGGTKFKINTSRTNGANGDIDGNLLVYQQFHGGKSDLKFFDLSDRDRRSLPGKVNTDQWEYWPSMSGDWLLFGRLYGNGDRKIFLFNLSTRASRLLGKAGGAGSFLAPGQVNGDYAIWSTCRSSTECDVVRYYIPDKAKEVIPNPGGRQHAASVTPDGTAYFARSRGCGDNVKLIRRSPEGKETVLRRIPSGDDVGTTKAYVDQQGTTTLLYDRFACGRAAQSDAWEIVEEASPSPTETTPPPTGTTPSPSGTTPSPTGTTPPTGFVLTVSKAGDGGGTVTSSPSGISCGTDCTQGYSAGTSVTLAADPAADSVFAGWGGACSGTGLTCTLTMDSDKSATATFNAKPVLTVSIAGDGSGTVTSDDGGINCGSGGTDCTQTYNPGDSVTLIAIADLGSLFTGWSGSCTADPCTLTMDADKSVTATFGLAP